jgi:hypothetical protein
VKFSFFFPAAHAGHHVLGCLMQGLLQLGHTVYSNIAPEKIASTGICPPFSKLYADEIIVTSDLSKGHLIVDAFHGLGKYSNALISSTKNNKVVLVNMVDEANWIDYDNNFLVFSGHFNKLAQRNGNIFPIGFGISQEAIDLSRDCLPKKRSKDILRNFRPSGAQSVRNALDLILLPSLKKEFIVTDNISSKDQYIEHLKTHKAVLTYCGDFYKDLRANPWFLENTKDSSLNFKEIASEPVILRFDSWRYYEAALFGACPISLDFQRYGLDNSANPTPWEEYIPIDLENIDEMLLKINLGIERDPEFFEKIGLGARNWVLKNHSPIGMAQRMIATMQAENFL